MSQASSPGPTRTAPSSNWPDELHTDRVHLEMTGDADGPGQAANCEPLAERRAEAVTSIRQHATEADTGRDYAIDLRQGDLWFCPFSSTFDRNAGSLQPHPIAGPTLGEEKAQGQHHWNFAAGECQGYQRLAVGVLAQGRSILRSDTDRVLALLRQCGVVDHQHSIAAADEPIRLNEQFGFQRCRIPHASSARSDDRRILNGIFYVLRTGMPWRDLPPQWQVEDGSDHK